MRNVGGSNPSPSTCRTSAGGIFLLLINLKVKLEGIEELGQLGSTNVTQKPINKKLFI